VLLTATFKICIFGDGGVGKTTLIQRYINGNFQQSTKMTIGVDISVKHLIMENIKINLQIWDFGGEERFRFFLPSYASGAFGGVFMYDTTRYSSLMDLEEWLRVFKQGVRYYENPVPIIMIGGKADIINQKIIQYEDAVNFAKANNISKVFECSSKTGDNVELIFNTLNIEILKNLGLIN
jgi:small GTP-binding protein